MWDLWRRLSRGNISLRRFLLLATSVMMAVFMVTTVFSQPTYAADVEREQDGASVDYDGNTYTKIDTDSFKNDAKTKDLPIISSQFDGYQFIDGDTLNLIITSDDATTATSGRAVSYKLQNGVYDPSTQSSVKTVSIENKAVEKVEADGSEESCTIEGVGWFVCPLMIFLADRMDDVMDILENFLTVRALQTDTTDNPIYEIWEMVRDLANVCFIIAFLIIVYSQVSNFGISNYGIKAMLPRLIIAAILVNASYWIVGLAIDVSNLLGMNLQEMFKTVREGLTGYDQLGDELSWVNVTSTVLAGGGAITAAIVVNGGIGASLTMLIPMLVGVLLAAVVAMVILAARQAIITLCIIIAPLAFVAYVLPSTQKYFDKWKDLFLTMLLMFPIVSFIMGAAQLAGYAIIANAGDSLLQIILGMAVQVAPIAITPFLIRISGNILGKVAGIVNNPSRGLVDRTRNWAQDRAKYQAAKVKSGAPLIDTKNNRLLNRSDRLRRAAEGINKVHGSRANVLNSAIRRSHRTGQRQRALTAAYESMAENNATEWDDNRYGSSSARNIAGHATARKSEIDNRFYGSTTGQKLEARTRAANIHKSELDNAFDRSHHDLTHRQQMADIDKQRVGNEFSETALGGQVDRARRIAESQKSRIENVHQAAWDNAASGNTNNAADLEIKQAVLEAKHSETKAGLAKAKLEQMQAEIIAQGDQSEHVIELRGANATTQTHILQIARDIKSDSLTTSAVSTAKAMAERQIVENRAQAYDENIITIQAPNGTQKTIVEYAAGIKGVVGERSVVAQAKAERSKFTVEDAKNIESTLSYDISSNPQALFNLFREAQTDSERVAYTSVMGKRGGPGASRLREMVRIMDDRLARGEITQTDLNDYKELVIAQNSGVLGLGKDLEFYFTNAAYGSDDAHPDLAGKVKTFDQIANDVSTWGNLSAESFSRMNIVNQLHGLNILAHKAPDKYRSLVSNLLRSPSAMANLKDDVVAAIQRRAEDERWFTGQYNLPTQDELTEFERHVLFEPRITQFDQRDGYEENPDYWKRKYDKLFERTEQLLDDARQRGVDYANAPEHKPSDN